jgi:uncharacterized protein
VAADRAIVITVGEVSAEAQLNESNTATAIWSALPISAKADTWGDEIYFDVDVTAGLESLQEVVEAGDLGFWPPGRAFCIFFGPTPMSRGAEIRPASPVSVVGRLAGDPKVFKTVRAGSRVTVRRAR